MSEPELDSIVSIAPVEPTAAEASPEAETVKAEAEAGEAEEDTTVATPAPSNANRLSKAENKTITGILERLTLYKDGEYVLLAMRLSYLLMGTGTTKSWTVSSVLYLGSRYLITLK
jgi:hypothetical protein